LVRLIKPPARDNFRRLSIPRDLAAQVFRSRHRILKDFTEPLVPILDLVKKSPELFVGSGHVHIIQAQKYTVFRLRTASVKEPQPYSASKAKGALATLSPLPRWLRKDNFREDGPIYGFRA
jgi:hypothetical protein